MNAYLLFPHQLFAETLAHCRHTRVYLVEHPFYFTQFPFHKQKLALHRASIRAFEERLTAAGAVCTFFSCGESLTLQAVALQMERDGVSRVACYELVDDWLERDVMENIAPRFPLKFVRTPMFLTPREVLDGYFKDRKAYRMADFYAWQRRRLGILVDSNGRPEGGRWSFDAENRKPIPKSVSVPASVQMPANRHRVEALEWVEQAFPDNYGESADFNYPITHDEAREVLDEFLEARFQRFGDYEDAMRADDGRLFHSQLTPALNIGLITPRQVVDTALEHAKLHGVPMNALEGFIRQIIGWREFIRGVYTVAGRRQRTRNAFRFSRPMPEAFWTGRTGLAPADDVISRVLKTGYCHHIERLMVLGSLMLLSEIHPDAVYAWFMTLFIDAYDWVMVPNVYGMSQYADSGLMSTKPYVSGSAYLQRMGDWPADAWTETWDGLYWSFVDRHRDRFAVNQRVGLAPLAFDRLAPERREMLRSAAAAFMERLLHGD